MTDEDARAHRTGFRRHVCIEQTVKAYRSEEWRGFTGELEHGLSAHAEADCPKRQPRSTIQHGESLQ